MNIINKLREEGATYAKDCQECENDPILLAAVRVAYVMGGKSVVSKWRDKLYDYVITSSDTNTQAKKTLKELGLLND